VSQTKWTVNEDGTFVLIARVINTAGTLVTQATVSTIGVEVSRRATDGTLDTVTLSTTAVVSTTIYDTAQTSAVLWPVVDHPDGYNLLYKVPNTAVPTGGSYYDAHLRLTMSNGDVIPVAFDGIYVARRLGDD